MLKAIESHKSNRAIKIVIFGSDKNPARGLAYSYKSSAYLLNMRSDTMSIWPDNPRHFFDSYKDGENSNPIPEYASRHFFGNYLENCWKSAQAFAKKIGIEIEYHNQRVVDLKKQIDDTYLIVSSDGTEIRANYTIMCLGLLPPDTYHDLRGSLGYLHEIYPELNKSASNNKRSAIILGSSLTAIDALFQLINVHRFKGRVSLVSHQGLLPQVQAAELPPPSYLGIQDIPVDDFSNLEELVNFVLKVVKPDLDLQSLSRLIEKEKAPIERLKNSIEAATSNRALAWQIPLMNLSRMMPKLWSRLVMADRLRFSQKYGSQWTAFRHSIPLLIAKKLLKLLENGQVEVLAGIKSIERKGGNRFIVTTDTTTSEADLLINATGSGVNVQKSNDQLLHNLLSRKIIQPHPCGGIYVDEDTCEVLNDRENKSHNLYLIGSLTQGVFFYTNALEMNAIQARDVVRSISDRL